MDDAYGLEGMGGPAGTMAGITAAGIRRRRGLRVALLSLAVTILLLGAAIAGIFGYHAISGGQPAAAAGMRQFPASTQADIETLLE